MGSQVAKTLNELVKPVDLNAVKVMLQSLRLYSKQVIYATIRRLIFANTPIDSSRFDWVSCGRGRRESGET